MTRTIFEIKSHCHLSMSMYIIHIVDHPLSKSKWVCGALCKIVRNIFTTYLLTSSTQFTITQIAFLKALYNLLACR